MYFRSTEFNNRVDLTSVKHDYSTPFKYAQFFEGSIVIPNMFRFFKKSAEIDGASFGSHNI